MFEAKKKKKSGAASHRHSGEEIHIPFTNNEKPSKPAKRN
jgi:hypothetical protein